jgi:protein ImuB
MFAVIHIPNFLLQAVLRHEPELLGAPVALVDDDSAKSKVWQVTAAAARFGISARMTSTQAKARCDKIAFRLRSTSQEEAAQEVLLECAYLSAAYLEATGPGLCTVDLRGLPILKTEDLAHTLNIWAGKLQARLDQFHLDAQIGIARTPALAAQAAHGISHFCYVTDPAAFWDKLPLESICSEPELLDVLSKWGIYTAGQFIALGKARIGERLGSAGVELFEHAKADTIRPLRLTSPKQSYEEFFEFEHLIETLDPLLFIVRRLLEQLVKRLEMASLSMSEIDVTLRLESGQVHRSGVKIASPTREVNALFRIVHNYLETVRTPSPIVALSLRAKPCEIDIQQFQLFETSVRDPNRFYETISRLGALLGPDRVGTPQMRDSFRPDDFELNPPSANAHPVDDSLVEAEARAPARGLPLRRFRPPLPATVRLKEGTPSFLDSTGPSGTVTNSRGPWRNSGNWWENLWSREEWDVQMKDGALYRIFLQDNRWFVEGAYD